MVGCLGESGLLLEVKHRAMACDFVVLVPDETLRVGHRSVADVVLKHLEAIEDIESVLTIYRSDSDVSRVNALAAEQPVHVNPEVFRLLADARSLSEQTDGAFDITAGPLVDAWGFTRREGRKPTREEIMAAMDRVGWQHLSLDTTNRTVRFEKPGMALNLGAIGKGYAIDQLANNLRSEGIEDFLIHAGYSSVFASGDQQLSTDENSPEHCDIRDELEGETRRRGWLVGVSHPTVPGRRLGGLWLQNRALSTSGSGKQYFHHQGRRYGHVIDPRTGSPAGQWLALTVTTETAMDADALSTAMFVMEDEKAKKLAEQRGMGLVLVGAGKRKDEVSMESCGPLVWNE